MTYNNIININNFSKNEKTLYLNLDKIPNNFSWYPLLLNDSELEDFNTSINYFIETPLSLIKNCEKSIYNNQYYLSFVQPNMLNKYNKLFYEMIDKINKIVLDKIKKFINVYNENNKNIFFENFQNPYSIENNKDLKIYIDSSQSSPLFYYSNMDIIPKNVYYTQTFMKEIINRKTKCVFKPMVWIKNHNNKILSGIKYFLSQCIISDIKNINEKCLMNKKILSFDNECSVCSICYSSMEDIEGSNYDTAITELSCKHKFHFKCINTWWLTQSQNNQSLSCPFCRSS